MDELEREQAKIILGKIHLLYPMFNREGNKEMAKLWLDQLEKGNFEKSHTALLNYSLENKYPPTLADIIIKDVIKDNKQDLELKEMEAAVNKEKQNPELNAKREKAIKEMQQRLRGLGVSE